jgi:hypothetical protein
MIPAIVNDVGVVLRDRSHQFIILQDSAVRRAYQSKTRMRYLSECKMIIANMTTLYLTRANAL